MSERHRMILRVNEDHQAAWVCPMCGRTLLVSSSGMQVINHGDFNATHYGVGVVGMVDATFNGAAQATRIEVDVIPERKHPWDRPVASDQNPPIQDPAIQGPWWEAAPGSSCKL